MNRASMLVALFGAAFILSASPVLAQTAPTTAPATQPEKAPKDKAPKEKDQPKDKAPKEKSKDAVGPADPGATAPDFTATDTDGKTVNLAALLKDGNTIVVLQWFNADCPFIRKHYGETKTFNDLAAKYEGKNVKFLAICSSAKGEQGAGQERNAKAKKDWNIAYPILLDESGTIGKAYGATNTPHMIVIAKDGKVAYNGAIDDDRGNTVGKTNYVAKAVDELLAGTNVTMAKTRPYGCPVKYSK